MASPLDDRGYKRFSGEDDDAGKQLRKFKAWAQAKMATMKDIQVAQHGPRIYTLLEGKALESVEHVTLEELHEKESEDQMGEALGECFGLCAEEGECMQQWAARVQEVFQKCRRKASVEFPSVAQGWIALNCSGLTEEQKAIVKAKTQGKLELPVITAALRSCNARSKDQPATSSSSTHVPGISDVNLVQTAGPNHDVDYEHEVSFVGAAELLPNDSEQEEVLSSGLISSPGSHTPIGHHRCSSHLRQCPASPWTPNVGADASRAGLQSEVHEAPWSGQPDPHALQQRRAALDRCAGVSSKRQEAFSTSRVIIM